MSKKFLRLFSLVLALCLCFALFACGGTQEPESEPTEPSAEQESEPEFNWTIDRGTPDPEMPTKVIFILVDGMRPDALEQIPHAEVMRQNSYYTYKAQSVVPPITLPCHVSIFHSVDPSVHGVTENTLITYKGTTIYDVLTENGYHSAMIYSWEPLRDLMHPGNDIYQYRKESGVVIGDAVNEELTNEALFYLEMGDPDFTFLYLGHPDSMGHTYEWMSQEYLDALQSSWNRIARIVDKYSKTHTIIVTADHGGHNKSHGKDIPEDMNVPLYILSPNIEPGEIQGDASLLDIMPTVVDLFGIEPVADFQGKSLLPKSE